MREMANKIQAVMNTLESLDIKSTYENTNKLLGCFQVLAEVRNNLNAVATIQEENAKKQAQKVIHEIEQVEEEQNVGTADIE